MTSHQAQLQALITEIESLLGKGVPRLPWSMTGEPSQQRRLLEQSLTNLRQLQAADPAAPSLGRAGNAIASDEVAPQNSEMAAQQVLQGLLQEIQYLRTQTMRPLANEVMALQQQREQLQADIRQLELERLQAREASGVLPNNSVWVGEVVEQLQSSLLEQLTPQLQALQAQINETPLLSSAPNDPREAAANLPQLHPQQRLDQLRQIQSETDYMLLKLDANLRTVFESMEQDIQGYCDSLSQGLEVMHGLGQQGETVFKAFINHLVQQLGQDSGYLSSGQDDATPLLRGEDRVYNTYRDSLASDDADMMPSVASASEPLLDDIGDIDLDAELTSGEEVTLFQLDEEIVQLQLEDEDDIDDDDATIIQTEPISWARTVGMAAAPDDPDAGDDTVSEPDTDDADTDDADAYMTEIDALYESFFGEPDPSDAADGAATNDSELIPADASTAVSSDDDAALDTALLSTDASRMDWRDLEGAGDDEGITSDATDANADDIAIAPSTVMADPSLAYLLDQPEATAQADDLNDGLENIASLDVSASPETSSEVDSTASTAANPADGDGGTEPDLVSLVDASAEDPDERSLGVSTIASLTELFPARADATGAAPPSPDPIGEDAFVSAPLEEDLLASDTENLAQELDLTLDEAAFEQLSEDLSSLEGLPRETPRRETPFDREVASSEPTESKLIESEPAESEPTEPEQVEPEAVLLEEASLTDSLTADPEDLAVIVPGTDAESFDVTTFEAAPPTADTDDAATFDAELFEPSEPSETAIADVDVYQAEMSLTSGLGAVGNVPGDRDLDANADRDLEDISSEDQSSELDAVEAEAVEAEAVEAEVFDEASLPRLPSEAMPSEATDWQSDFVADEASATPPEAASTVDFALDELLTPDGDQDANFSLTDLFESEPDASATADSEAPSDMNFAFELEDVALPELDSELDFAIEPDLESESELLADEAAALPIEASRIEGDWPTGDDLSTDDVVLANDSASEPDATPTNTNTDAEVRPASPDLIPEANLMGVAAADFGVTDDQDDGDADLSTDIPDITIGEAGAPGLPIVEDSAEAFNLDFGITDDQDDAADPAAAIPAADTSATSVDAVSIEAPSAFDLLADGDQPNLAADFALTLDDIPLDLELSSDLELSGSRPDDLDDLDDRDADTADTAAIAALGRFDDPDLAIVAPADFEITPIDDPFTELLTTDRDRDDAADFEPSTEDLIDEAAEPIFAEDILLLQDVDLNLSMDSESSDGELAEPDAAELGHGDAPDTGMAVMLGSQDIVNLTESAVDTADLVSPPPDDQALTEPLLNDADADDVALATVIDDGDADDADTDDTGADNTDANNQGGTAVDPSDVDYPDVDRADIDCSETNGAATDTPDEDVTDTDTGTVAATDEADVVLSLLDIPDFEPDEGGLPAIALASEDWVPDAPILPAADASMPVRSELDSELNVMGSAEEGFRVGPDEATLNTLFATTLADLPESEVVRTPFEPSEGIADAIAEPIPDAEVFPAVATEALVTEPGPLSDEELAQLFPPTTADADAIAATASELSSPPVEPLTESEISLEADLMGDAMGRVEDFDASDLALDATDTVQLSEATTSDFDLDFAMEEIPVDDIANDEAFRSAFQDEPPELAAPPVDNAIAAEPIVTSEPAAAPTEDPVDAGNVSIDAAFEELLAIADDSAPTDDEDMTEDVAAMLEEPSLAANATASDRLAEVASSDADETATLDEGLEDEATGEPQRFDAFFSPEDSRSFDDLFGSENSAEFIAFATGDPTSDEVLTDVIGDLNTDIFDSEPELPPNNLADTGTPEPADIADVTDAIVPELTASDTVILPTLPDAEPATSDAPAELATGLPNDTVATMPQAAEANIDELADPTLEADLTALDIEAEAGFGVAETDFDPTSDRRPDVADIELPAAPEAPTAVEARSVPAPPAPPVPTADPTEVDEAIAPDVDVEPSIASTAGVLAAIPAGDADPEDPTSPSEAASSRPEWFLGIDFGTGGLSAVLMNRVDGAAHPFYWSNRRSAGASENTFRIPTVAALRDRADADTDALELRAVGIAAYLEATTDRDLQLINTLKPLLRVGIPHQSEPGSWEPIVQWSTHQPIPLDRIAASVQALIALTKQSPGSMLELGAVGLEVSQLSEALANLQGVIVGHPNNWADTYCINVREAILAARLVDDPNQIFFVEEAIAAILSGLPDPGELLDEPGRQTQTLYQCNWQGGTVVISAGASCTEVGLVDLPYPLNALIREDFVLRNLAYGGDALDLDIICQLLLPPERRKARTGSDRRSSRDSGWNWQPALAEITDARWDDLAIASLNLPQLAEPDVAARVHMRQHLESSDLGRGLLEAARYLKLILQNQAQFHLELADQSWRVLRRDLESRVLVPYIQRLNQQLNALLSQTGLSAQGVNQVICTGGNTSFATIAKWLRQKFPNATIIQDTYPNNRPPSCSRVAYGLVNLCRYPQVLDIPRHQYSDYFLLKEMLRVVPDQPLPLSGILHLLTEQGINTDVCQSRILAILEGHLPPGLIPDATVRPYLSSATLDHDLDQALNAAPLFTRQSGDIYMLNPQQRYRIDAHLTTLLANKRQSLAEPLIAQLVIP